MAARIDASDRGPKDDLEDIVSIADEPDRRKLRSLRTLAVSMFTGLILTVAAANIYAANMDPVSLSGQAGSWDPARIWAFVSLLLTAGIIVVVRSYNTLMLGVMRQAIETMVRSEATMARAERVVGEIAYCASNHCPNHHTKKEDL